MTKHHELREGRMIFRAPGAKHIVNDPPGGRIPEKCSRCGRTITWWNGSHGHMVQVRCDDPRLKGTE